MKFIYRQNYQLFLNPVSDSMAKKKKLRNFCYISCEKTNLHSSAYLDSQQVWLIAAASRTGSIVRLSTKLAYNACQLSNVRLLGSLMMDDRWERLPRLQPALFDVSGLAPLSSSVQKSLVRLNQQQAALAPSVESSSERRSKQRPGDLFRELPGAVHSSLLLNRSRVVSCFSATNWRGPVANHRRIRQRGQEKPSYVFAPFKWKRLASEADGSAGSIPSTKKTGKAAAQKCAHVSHWSYCHKRSTSTWVPNPQHRLKCSNSTECWKMNQLSVPNSDTQESKSLHLRANYHLASRSKVAAG